MEVKLFSYNIRGLPFFPDSWTEPLAEWFINCDYDIVCLQEVFTHGRLQSLTKALVSENYTVRKPNDFAKGTNLLGSGLLTAVKSDRWIFLNEGFTQFTQFTGAENLANKGFHWLLLVDKNTQKQLIIINTHMQADNPCNYFSGCVDTRPIREKQMGQIVEFLHTVSGIRHLIIGDINSESEPHTEILYLTGPKNGIKKHTFEPTGEDLDHVAIMPKLMSKPTVKEVSVLTKLWWSDHWPLHAVLDI